MRLCCTTQGKADVHRNSSRLLKDTCCPPQVPRQLPNLWTHCTLTAQPNFETILTQKLELHFCLKVLGMFYTNHTLCGPRDQQWGGCYV
jgi:hypothetical protein